MRSEKVEFYGLKRQMQHYYDQKLNVPLKVTHFLKSSGAGGETLTFRPQVVNQLQRKEIDIKASVHTKMIQRSNYIQIDNDAESNFVSPGVDAEDARGHFRKQSGNHRTAKVSKSVAEPLHQEGISLKYCQPEEVNTTRRKYLHFKGQFAVRHSHIKKNGQRLELVSRLHQWVEENLEELFKVLGPAVTKRSKSEAGKSKNEALYDIKHRIGKCCGTLRKDDLNRFASNLMDVAEEMVNKRRVRQRAMCIEEIKEVVDPKKPYNYKENLVDNRIAQELDYFSHAKKKSDEVRLYDRKFRRLSRVL